MSNSGDFEGSGPGAPRPSAPLKLTYFDFHGGRGEPARIALSIGGIPFEDDRVKRRRLGAPQAGHAVRRFAPARE